MELSNVKNIETTDGIVRYIQIIKPDLLPVNRYGLTYVWRKPFELPALTFSINVPFYNEMLGFHNSEYLLGALTDKYGVSQWFDLPMPYIQTNDVTTIMSVLYLQNINTTTGKKNREYTDWIGQTLRAYSISNVSEMSNIALNGHEVLDAEWTTSDTSSGKIKLYATPVLYGSEGSIEWNDVWTAGSRVKALNVIKGNDVFSDRADFIFEVSHITDIMVDIETPLITLSSYKGATTEIKSINTDFDDYKAKYEAAGGSKFPKSQYPYLRGIIKLDCKSPALGINSTCGMYLTFSELR